MKTGYVLATCLIATLWVAGCYDNTSESSASDYNADPVVAIAAQVDAGIATCPEFQPVMEQALFEYFAESLPARCLDCGSPARVVVNASPESAYTADIFLPGSDGMALQEFQREAVGANGVVYAIVGSSLVVTAGGEPDAAESSITLKNGAARLALNEAGDRLVVVTPVITARNPTLVDAAQQRRSDVGEILPVVEVLFLDLSDPQQPHELRRLRIDGGLLGGAGHGSGIVLVVRRSWPQKTTLADDAGFQRIADEYQSAMVPAGSGSEIEQRMRARIHSAVGMPTISELSPALTDSLQISGRSPFVATCSDVIHPKAHGSLPELTVVALLDWSGSVVDRIALLDGGRYIFVSANRIDITRHSGADSPVTYHFEISDSQISNVSRAFTRG